MPDEESPDLNRAMRQSVRRSLFGATIVIALFAVAGGLILNAGLTSGSMAVHAQIEFFAVFTGFSVFFLASAKYVVSRERLYLPLALGVLAASLLDLAHPAVGSFLESLRGGGSGYERSEYLWFLSRLAFAVGLFLAAWAHRDRGLDARPGRWLTLGAALTILGLAVVVVATIALPVPNYYFDAFGGRPVLELVPIPFFVAAAYFLLRPGRASPHGIQLVGLSAVLLGIVVQSFAFFSHASTTGIYFSAHVAKVGNYLVILFGLYLEHVRLYSLERGLRESLEAAHAEVRTANLELDAIINDLTDGIVISDEAGRILRVNRAAEEVLGEPPTLGVRPERYSEAYGIETPDGRPFPLDEYPIVRALRTGQKVQGVELVVRRKSGERRALIVGAVPLRDARGRIRGAVAAFNDVTDMRTAEQRFRDLTEGAPDGIIVADERWRIVLFNHAAELLTGFQRRDVFGRDVATLFPERFRDKHLADREAFAASGPPQLERPLNMRGLRQDGTEVPVEVNISTSTTSTGRFYIAHIRDVTDRERSRREREGILSVALSSSATHTVDEFLQRATAAISSATEFDACTVFLHDPSRNTLVLRASHGLADEVRERIAQYPLDPSFPAIAVQTWFQREILTESELATRTDLHVTAQLVTKYGFRSIISAPVGSDAEPMGVLQVVATEGRNPRGDDLQIMELLAQELAVGVRQKRLIQQLEQSTRELRQTNEELDSFIYTASHDLAEPLRSISNFSHFLLEDYSSKLDTEGQDYLRRVHAGALRMKRLLDDLLRLSRHGRIRSPHGRVDVADVLEEVQESLDATLRERNAVIVIGPNLPAVIGDRTSLMEVFVNLIGNGIKFNEDPHPRIEVRALRHNGMVEFQVTDNGIGIAPEHHERIFSLFTRLHARKDYPGTGAGLAIVKKIIEQHGGTIGVRSEPGHGSTFHFTLPAAPAPIARLEIPKAGTAVP